MVFKKKNVGSGLILGSVGLRQYNNFFFWPNRGPGITYTIGDPTHIDFQSLDELKILASKCFCRK